MLHIERRGSSMDHPLSRRCWLSIGSGGLLGGLSLGQWFARQANGQTASGQTQASPAPRAKACIQIFLWGGPGAQETWDLKPNAPDQCRGAFQPIQTTVPGWQVCEHLPLLAARADRYTIVRSLTHTGVNHGTSAYHMLTGHIHFSPGTLRHPSPSDMPNIAINAARFLPHPEHLPACVHLPSVINDGDGLNVPGQEPGILGVAHSAFRIDADLTQPSFRIPELVLADGVSPGRLAERMELRNRLFERLSAAGEAAAPVESSYKKALNLLASADTAQAFELAREPPALREAYGYHHFAQGLLLARRLVEAGVPLITVFWNSPSNADDQSWDTHSDQHRRMKDHLLPAFDRGVSALLDDLDQRGLLEQTLVTWYGEFGRTPKINGAGGRDHWGFCQSIGLAGGGIHRGQVYGTSTRDGGYAETNPVSPDDLAATIYHCLGIDHTQLMHDLAGRPIPLSYGHPVQALLA